MTDRYAGNVYVAWETNDVAPANTAQNANTIKLMASSDLGQDFTYQAYLNNHNTGHLYDQPKIAISQGTPGTPTTGTNLTSVGAGRPGHHRLRQRGTGRRAGDPFFDEDPHHRPATPAAPTSISTRRTNVPIVQQPLSAPPPPPATNGGPEQRPINVDHHRPCQLHVAPGPDAHAQPAVSHAGQHQRRAGLAHRADDHPLEQRGRGDATGTGHQRAGHHRGRQPGRHHGDCPGIEPDAAVFHRHHPRLGRQPAALGRQRGGPTRGISSPSAASRSSRA